MALFKKKEKKQEVSRLPELPKLPELPDFPETDNFPEEDIPKLPSFPMDSLGNRFSQDTIKEAVTGKKGVEEVEADEFADDEFPGRENEFPEEKETRLMRKPLTREEPEREFFPKFQEKEEVMEESVFPKVKEKEISVMEEPIFVRIDRFEEGSKEFEQIKLKVSEIEKMLGDIKRVKEKEDRDLESWKEEIRNIKEKIESVDKNIFSKLD